jgi:hypothetical protein
MEVWYTCNEALYKDEQSNINKKVGKPPDRLLPHSDIQFFRWKRENLKNLSRAEKRKVKDAKDIVDSYNELLKEQSLNFIAYFTNEKEMIDKPIHASLGTSVSPKCKTVE